MINQKETGSYYTPPFLANFITNRVIDSLSDTDLRILEPSVGDGAFVSEFMEIRTKNISLTALDINGNELDKAKEKWDNVDNFQNIDFLDFEADKTFSAVIGNPPYINKKLIKEDSLEKIKRIHFAENLSENSVNNIWTSFLIKSCSLLDHNGVIAFVLPSELLQVNYAKELREFLIRRFARIEIFTFNDLMFDCKGQDTILLIGYVKHLNKGQFFTNIDSADRLVNNDFILEKNEILVENDTKWSHHILTGHEIEFLSNLKRRLQTVNELVISQPGIVTAANDFFIINKETEDKFNLHNYTKTIVKKGLYVNKKITFDDSDIESLQKKNLPTRFLNLQDSDVISDDLQKYLDIGELNKINIRYKCKKRKKWFVVPNVSTPPEAFFFKRSHLYPKIVKNNTNSLVTDSAYKIKMKEGFEINSFIYSFYNSLTLVFAELEGRYYGGGVLELIPSEFKCLPLPYVNISEDTFERFVNEFENINSIEDILRENNFHILNTSLDLTDLEIEEIEEIRIKLISKRTRR
ncbi:Eco57I restriction-modification methylase domain-containing protein [Chryseobacterium sp. Hurlbut01]|uniref:Eco57I restriction-modification methylase domain-containing protein n=1 Tax=Chryseobacterium sp. Hurlbut01 TaxID=1681828 RepID=UPI00067AF5B6|nr:Eco57I restriction-modification methylase domain-containing protein [Chryseobacterium sp. Hurlbut01]KNB62255.1 type I restriction endonuclease subunit M [Chryseobacterium sp. Hurlbut01]